MKRTQGKAPSTAKQVSIRHRQLGDRLRTARTAAGLRQDDAAQMLELHPVTLSKIENGHTSVKPMLVREMARIYGLPTEVADELAARAAGPGAPGWTVSYRDVIPEQVSALADIEARATAMVQYETEFMPFLLQTPAYAEHVIGLATQVSPERRQAHLNFRLERQTRLLTRNPRPKMHFIIHEAIFRAHVGSDTLMSDQFAHVVNLSRQRSIDVRVWRFKDGLHQWMSGAFTLLQSDGEWPHVAYTENQVEGRFDEDVHHVEEYARLFGIIRRKATPIREFQL
ncbi:helix-turn-helix domain-containing protein [Kineosporia babensis]|uniref:Helix-turn-helix domain-containing protein n=1 Tax=Kineosporia babensis TaxID=499548 RepID=A0A9X1T512_9ACTN|nr:helix-turn-helix domain-containing protein [Kineosporia babensis]